MPRTTCRVVWGRPEVIATFWPTMAFVSVDLPAFGRPMTHAKPDLNSTATSSPMCAHSSPSVLAAARAASSVAT